MTPRIPSAPLRVEWELTCQCNQRCLFCFNAGHASERELNYDGARKIVDELDRNNVFDVVLSGGEPFLYSEMYSLLKYISQKKLRVNILSNGTIIEENLVQLISRHKTQFTIQISIEGLMNTHDAIVRLEGAFDRVMKKIDMLKEYEVHFLPVTTLTSMNYREIPHMYNFFLKKGIKTWRILTLIPFGAALTHNLNLSLAEYRWVYSQLHEKLKKSPGMDMEIRCPSGLPLIEHFPDRGDERAQWIGCSGGISYFQITPIGNVYPCCLLRGEQFFAGNLTEEPLEKIWNSPAMQFLRDNYYNITGKCTCCYYSHVCRGGCKALSHTICGDFRMPDPRCLYDPSANLTLPEFFQEESKEVIKVENV